MGLLDDAIREHLELKRRHGADPAEVAQLEREAFGPAQSAPAPLELPARDDREPVDPVLVEPEVDAPDPAPGEAPTRLHDLPAEGRDRGPVSDDLAWQDAATEPDEEPGQPTVAWDATEVAEAQGRPQRADDPPATRRARDDDR